MRSPIIQLESLPLITLKEGNSFIVYTPVLDLSVSGDTYEQAHQSFREVLKLFFEELISMRTLEKVLIPLGWRKWRQSWIPPLVISQHAEDFSPLLAHV